MTPPKPARLTDEQLDAIAKVLEKRDRWIIDEEATALLDEVRAGRELRRKLDEMLNRDRPVPNIAVLLADNEWANELAALLDEDADEEADHG